MLHKKYWKKFSHLGIGLLSLAILMISLSTMNFVSCQLPTSQPPESDSIIEAAEVSHVQTFGSGMSKAVWSFDPEAFSWEGSGIWFDSENINKAKLKGLLVYGLLQLAGEDNIQKAWDILFRDFNLRYYNNESSYHSGEKIFIKLNSNGFINPYTIRFLLEELVLNAGVDPKDITIYSDNNLNLSFVNKWSLETMLESIQELKGVNTLTRNTAQFSQVKIHWSDPDQIYYDSNDTTPINSNLYLPQAAVDAQYIINLTSLKGHRLAGFTMAGKNLFGMFQDSPHNSGLHPSIAAKYHSYGPVYQKRPMGSYNALVDLIGHPQLGQKTMLILTDALIVSLYQNPPLDLTYTPQFEDAPFNGNWPNSIFLSQNYVSIDSLGLSFMEAESAVKEMSNRLTQNNYSNSALPDGHTAWNYLEEAASASSAPSGTIYKPDGITPCGDLGEIINWSYSKN